MSNTHDVMDAEYFVALCDSPEQQARRERRRSRDRRNAALQRFVALAVFALAVIWAFTSICNALDAGTPAEKTEVSQRVVDSVPVLVFDEDFPMLDQEYQTEEAPARNGQYVNIEMTAAERDELAAVVFLEAGNQSAEGQQAVVEVVLNRVNHPGFPDNVHDVLHEGEGTNRPQFSTVGRVGTAEPTQAQYDAIDAALHGEAILPADVVFFSRKGENDRVWGAIGDHVFCYEYIWG